MPGHGNAKKGRHTRISNQSLKEGTGTKLPPENKVNPKKGKTQSGYEQLCPLVKNPGESCYCYNLDTQVNIKKALYYCTAYFRDCEIYISIKKENDLAIESTQFK